jgi:hypothetical protein
MRRLARFVEANREIAKRNTGVLSNEARLADYANFSLGDFAMYV